MLWQVGSAFYGLYFVVSFPAYFALDEPGGDGDLAATPRRRPLLEAATSALASGMLVLLALDLVRLAVVGVPLRIGGRLVEVTG